MVMRRMEFFDEQVGSNPHPYSDQANWFSELNQFRTILVVFRVFSLQYKSIIRNTKANNNAADKILTM